MKYTPEEAKRLKNKGMSGFHKYNKWIPTVTIKDGYYIVESKMNINTP
jgi:hypothetical protein